jgi:uncharacterized protein (DUF1330 family)
MMPAYLLIEARISDPLAYETYERMAAATLAQYGGRCISSGDNCEVLEGKWGKPERLVIVEFDSVALAKKFYNSSEYATARAARADAAEINIMVVDGLPT